MKKITAIMLAAIMLIVCVAVSVSAAQDSAVIHSEKVLKATATVDGNLDPAYLQSMKVSINPPKYAGVETNVKATVYALYDNKISDGSESAQCKASLAARMKAIGYEIVTARGDIIK